MDVSAIIFLIQLIDSLTSIVTFAIIDLMMTRQKVVSGSPKQQSKQVEKKCVPILPTQSNPRFKAMPTLFSQEEINTMALNLLVSKNIGSQ